MMYKTIISSAFLVALLAATPTFASQVTGTLSSGVSPGSQVGGSIGGGVATLTGTVVGGSSGSGTSGGGGGGGGGSIGLFGTSGASNAGVLAANTGSGNTAVSPAVPAGSVLGASTNAPTTVPNTSSVRTVFTAPIASALDPQSDVAVAGEVAGAVTQVDSSGAAAATSGVGMSWWWLLLLLVLAAMGYGYYRYSLQDQRQRR